MRGLGFSDGNRNDGQPRDTRREVERAKLRRDGRRVRRLRPEEDPERRKKREWWRAPGDDGSNDGPYQQPDVTPQEREEYERWKERQRRRQR